MGTYYLSDESVRMNAMVVDQLGQGGEPGLGRNKVLKNNIVVKQDPDPAGSGQIFRIRISP